MKFLRSAIACSLVACTLSFSTLSAAVDPAAEKANISEAMALYAKAVPMDTQSPERATLLKESAAILTQVIKENPESLEAHRKLMGVYLLQQDYSRGIRTMQEAITLSPEDPKLFITLAFLYEHSGAFEYAKAMLNQALALDPANELAKEYRTAIEKKIASRNVEDMHKGQMPKDSVHGKPVAAGATPHPPIAPQSPEGSQK